MNAVPPKNCPSISSEEAGKASACAGCPNQKLCASGEAKQAAQAELETVIPLIAGRLIKVKHIILVISGKGGTGKSTVSCTLARALANDGNAQVGLLDLDICGPSAPRMFGLEGEQVHKSSTGWTPVYVADNLAIMSCGFLLDTLDDAVIWRGPKKNTMIKQFLTDVDWDQLDYLIVDTPPGTSDEHISIVQYLKQTNLPNFDGAIMVTTPQEVSLMDVRKQIDFCRRTNLKVIGVIENMAIFKCPKCSQDSIIFPSTSGGCEKMASDFDLEILGRLPLDPLIGKFCDSGYSIFGDPVLEQVPRSSGLQQYNSDDIPDGMKKECAYLDNITNLFIEIKDKMIAKINRS